MKEFILKFAALSLFTMLTFLGFSQSGLKLSLQHNTANREIFYNNSFSIGSFQKSSVNPGFGISYWKDFELGKHFVYSPAIGFHMRGVEGVIESIEFKNSAYSAFVDTSVKLVNPFNFITKMSHFILLGNRLDINVYEASNAVYKSYFNENMPLSASAVMGMGWYVPIQQKDQLLIEFEYSPSIHNNNKSESWIRPYSINRIRYINYTLNLGYRF